MRTVVELRLGQAPDFQIKRWATIWLGVVIACLLAWAPGSARAAMYLGSELTDLKPEEKVTIANPQPVQLIFEFRTKGTANGRATKYVKKDVVETVKGSGLFSEVSEEVTTGGAILNIVIDNVVEPKQMNDAMAKGVATGATLFIAGSNIRDYYVCTVDYLPADGAAKLTRTAHQSLVTQMGLINSAPDNAVKIDGGMKVAIAHLVQQIISNPLNELARDPQFVGGAPLVADAAPATPEAVAPQAQAPAAEAASPPPSAEPPTAPPAPEATPQAEPAAG